jgi:hypothetical protein
MNKLKTFPNASIEVSRETWINIGDVQRWINAVPETFKHEYSLPDSFYAKVRTRLVNLLPDDVNGILIKNDWYLGKYDVSVEGVIKVSFVDEDDKVQCVIDVVIEE